MRILKFLPAAAIAAAIALGAQPAQAEYSQAEMEQMLAPIALYPDDLLFQVLAAATRPLEVVEAARWSRGHPGLRGDEAVRAAESEPWDPSVKALLAFPQLLARMDQDLEWTKALGQAYFVQEPAVLEAIQELRQRARAAGQLDSDDRMTVLDQGPAIYIESAAPEVLYLPYYDPLLVYGTWFWPNYPPVIWAPWPGYVAVHRPGHRPGFWWGPPLGVSANLFHHHPDWRRRDTNAPRPAPPSGRTLAPGPVAPQRRPPLNAPQQFAPTPRALPPSQTVQQSAPIPRAGRPASPVREAPPPKRERPAPQSEPRPERRAHEERRAPPPVARPAPPPAATPRPPMPAPRVAPSPTPQPQSAPLPASAQPTQREAREAPQRPGVARP